MTRRALAAALGAGFLLLGGLSGCRQEPVVSLQEFDAERSLRVQAEDRAEQNEKRAGRWQHAAVIAAAGGALLLVVGAALGSMGKRDAR